MITGSECPALGQGAVGAGRLYPNPQETAGLLLTVVSFRLMFSLRRTRESKTLSEVITNNIIPPALGPEP